MNIQFNLAQHGFEVVRNFGLNPTAEDLAALANRLTGQSCTLVAESSNWPPETWQQSDPTLTLILHLALEDCGFFDGALKLCPASHKHGELTPQQIRGHAIRPFSAPELKAGDVLAYHPLTIHASAACRANSRPRSITFLLR
jgi:ectoine hydroxylase-related dioxygenase (phytanoyl-CoA dioxygenase family)